ncbi:hypothetical protein [Nocardioides sp. W7]|uniref:hypothetical protein n=1 Tax=Nocardioides sp. W7 TaxID=2931390 RepID=UPI001FD2A229|nr:hypothetical protein [Nocardioides sp. W7]
MPLPTLDRIPLEAPDKGQAQLTHDATFTAWDDAFTTMRDVVNHGIDALNHVGAGLPRLPEESLESLLILPLTGDYATIQRNAAACVDVRDALHAWGDNILRISLAVDPAWHGQAAAAYLLRVNAFGLAARGIGETVRLGAIVFEEIAKVSERIGIEVERLVVELGKTLVRLGRRLLSKIAGPGGWAAFAGELLLKGLDAVTDIIDDVRRVLELIDHLRELRDVVVDWVEEQRHRLGLFRDLPSLVRS